MNYQLSTLRSQLLDALLLVDAIKMVHPTQEDRFSRGGRRGPEHLLERVLAEHFKLRAGFENESTLSSSSMCVIDLAVAKAHGEAQNAWAPLMQLLGISGYSGLGVEAKLTIPARSKM